MWAGFALCEHSELAEVGGRVERQDHEHEQRDQRSHEEHERCVEPDQPARGLELAHLALPQPAHLEVVEDEHERGGHAHDDVDDVAADGVGDGVEDDHQEHSAGDHQASEFVCSIRHPHSDPQRDQSDEGAEGGEEEHDDEEHDGLNRAAEDLHRGVGAVRLAEDGAERDPQGDDGEHDRGEAELLARALERGFDPAQHGDSLDFLGLVRGCFFLTCITSCVNIKLFFPEPPLFC